MGTRSEEAWRPAPTPTFPPHPPLPVVSLSITTLGEAVPPRSLHGGVREHRLWL